MCLILGMLMDSEHAIHKNYSFQPYDDGTIYLATFIVANRFLRNFLIHVHCISKLSMQFLATQPMWPCLPTFNYVSLGE